AGLQGTGRACGHFVTEDGHKMCYAVHQRNPFSSQGIGYVQLPGGDDTWQHAWSDSPQVRYYTSWAWVQAFSSRSQAPDASGGALSPSTTGRPRCDATPRRGQVPRAVSSAHDGPAGTCSGWSIMPTTTRAPLSGKPRSTSPIEAPTSDWVWRTCLTPRRPLKGWHARPCRFPPDCRR